MKTKVTKKQFAAFEEVRESGVTNMMDLNTVSNMSALSKETIKAIISNYDSLCKSYPGVRAEIR